MEPNDRNLHVEQEPRYALWMGLFPFVLLGVMAVLFETPREWENVDSLMKLAGLLMFGGYLVILAGLYFGAVTGFPRWVFPYLVYAFVFALYISNASTPGLVVFGVEMWGRELWGWRALVPVGLVMLLVPLLNRHPRRFLVSLWNGIKEDWSRVGFGLYGLFPFIVFVIFDEVENTYSFPGVVAGEIMILVGAALYLRLKSPFRCTFAMVVFAFLGVLAANIVTNYYWDTHFVNFATGESHLLEGPIPYTDILMNSLTGAIVVSLFLLIPTLIFGFAVHLSKTVKEGLQDSG